ncbi:hypothetical protein ALTERO38_40015 [Alteromonas sp. 38]|nr:hypothetical protein ALTER154_90236 [Alteromonas sp. 154]VXB15317.1 hypothetical protein ALTERO38_40015 [Alteromonas sp. 38]
MSDMNSTLETIKITNKLEHDMRTFLSHFSDFINNINDDWVLKKNNELIANRAKISSLPVSEKMTAQKGKNKSWVSFLSKVFRALSIRTLSGFKCCSISLTLAPAAQPHLPHTEVPLSFELSQAMHLHLYPTTSEFLLAANFELRGSNAAR